MKKLFAVALSSALVVLLSGMSGAAFASAQNVRTLSVEDGPTGVAMTPDGLTALVANSGSDSVSVISLASETVMSTITVGIGDGPQDLVVSLDGSRAFVTNYFSHDVSVIDLDSLTVVDTISLGGAPFSMTLSADGTKAVVPDSISGIYVIDLTNYDVVYYPLETSSAPVFAAISTDGLTAYVTGVNTGSVYVVNLASGSVNTFPLSLGMIYGITLNAMGDAAYVAVYGGGAGSTVVEVDVTTGDVLATLTAAGAPETMTLAPDGQSLLVTTQYNGLVVLNLADSSLNETVPMGQDLRHVALNAAGTTAVVTSNADGTATLVDFDPALVARPAVVTAPDAQLADTGASPMQTAIPLVALVLILAGLAVFGIRHTSLRRR